MKYKEIKNNIREDYQEKLYICKELFWNIMTNPNIEQKDKDYLNSLLDDNAKLYLYQKEFDDEVLKDYKKRKELEEKRYQEELKKNPKAKRKGAFDTRNPESFYANILIGNITEYISLFYFYQKGDSIIKNPFASHGKTVNSNFDFIYIRGSQNYQIEMQTYYTKKEYIQIKQTKFEAGKQLTKDKKKAYFLNFYMPKSAKYEDIEISFMNVNNMVRDKKYKEHLFTKQFGGKEMVELTEKLEWKKDIKSLKDELK